MRRLVSCLVVFSVLLVAGCGGGDDVTTESFRTNANAICAELLNASEDQLEARYVESLGEDPDPTDLLLEVVGDTVDQLGNVEVPSELGSSVDRWMEALQDRLRALESAVHSADSEDAEGLQDALQEVTDASARAAAISQELGLVSCR